MKKMNRMQVQALCEKIKSEAKKKQAAYKASLETEFVMSEAQQEEYEDSLEMKKLMDAFNQKYPSTNSYHHTRVSWDCKSPKTLIDIWKEQYVSQFPKLVYNFTDLENDIILASMGSGSIEELITNALETYKVEQ